MHGNFKSYFPSYNYRDQHDKTTYYDCWITLKTALKIVVSNLYCKITLVWLDYSLSVVANPTYVYMWWSNDYDKTLAENKNLVKCQIHIV